MIARGCADGISYPSTLGGQSCYNASNRIAHNTQAFKMHIFAIVQAYNQRGAMDYVRSFKMGTNSPCQRS